MSDLPQSNAESTAELRRLNDELTRTRDALREALRELAGAASGDMGIQCADAVYQRLNRAIAAAREALEKANG